MPEKSAEEHLLRDSEMKCIICHSEALPDHDLCEECDEFKTQLAHFATSHKRRALITGTLVYYAFNIVDLEEDRECPIKCGYCCRTGWASVLSLRYKFGKGEDGQFCPHLKEDGCELPRKDRPNGCVAFLCPLAWHVTAGRMTVVEAKALLAKHKGNSETASASLDKRQLKEVRSA